MKIHIEVSEAEVKKLVSEHIEAQLGEVFSVKERDQLIIEVKSKQNYQSEWESANFRATYKRSF